jgi:HPt (histidine-containing phosphotransfer) domain-containing protein
MNLGKIAHKMKPSMTFMSIPNGKELCTEIEDLTIKNPSSENLKPKVYELIEMCKTAFVVLESELEKLR